VFAFGCMLYEATTRRRPFAAETNVETLHRILHDVPAPVEELNPQAPTELRRLIRRCIAKDPNQRVQSMKDVALELQEINQDYQTLLAPSGAESRARVATSAGRAAAAMQRWATWTTAASALLAMAILLLVGVLWYRPSERPAAVRFVIPSPPGMTF